jgi:hypothetical protein
VSFAERVLSFAFSGAPGFLGAPSGSFTAQGLRAAASIQAAGGRLGTQAQVKIWGLSLAQMNAYSSAIAASIGGAGRHDAPERGPRLRVGDARSSRTRPVRRHVFG